MMNTCPLCGRTFEVTVYDDTFVPACGHFGDNPRSGEAPCEDCGLGHAYSCPEMPRYGLR